MEKTNGFYVYDPQKEDEERKKKQQEKEQKNEYLEALKKNNRVPTQEEEYYAELQKTLNGETKDLPEIGFFDKVYWSIEDLAVNKLQGGFFKSIEGMIDTMIDFGGTIGSIFGASDQWAKDARSFDLTNWLQNNIGQQEAIWDWFTPGNQKMEALKEHEAYSWFNQDGLGGFLGSAVEGVGGLLPSIAIGQGAGAMAGGLGGSASTAMQIGSTVSFGMGAMGQATQEALNEGASYEEAKIYGLASGLMETGIEMLSGGIGGVGTGAVQKLFPKLTRNSIVKFVSGAVGEGIEEMASEMITPYLKRVTYNEKAPNSTTEQVLEAGLIGALVGSVMQGGQIIVTPKGVRIGNNIEELLEVQNQYYENGQFAKAEAISKKIVQLQEQFATELEKANVDVENIKLTINSEALNKLDEKMSKETLEDGISKYQEARDRIQQEYDTVLENMDSEKRSNYIIEKGISYKYDLDTGKVNDKWNTYSKEQQQSLKEASDFVNKVNKRMVSKFKIVFNHDVQEGTDINSVLYDGDNIIVNANADINQVKQSVAKHEVTHALENTKNYKTIKDIVLSIEKKNNEYERKMQQIRSKYAENSNLKDAFNKMSVEEQNTYLEQELVAEYVRENLFTSEESINKLAKEHTSIAKRILNFIKEKINSLKQDKDARETSKLLKKAENLYIKAIEEFDKTQVEKIVEKYSLKEKKTPPTEDETKKAEEVLNKVHEQTSNPNEAILIKAYANWKAKKTFTKKEIDEAVSKIMEDVSLNGEHTVKYGADVLNKILFIKLNTIKSDTKPKVKEAIIEDVATTIVEYTELINKFKYSENNKRVAIDLVKGEIKVFYETYGKTAQFIKFKEEVKSQMKKLMDENKDIRERSKLTLKIVKLASDFEKYTTNGDKKTIRSRIITSQMEAMAGLLKKIKYGSYISGTVRQKLVEYRDKFYNELNSYDYYIKENGKLKIVSKEEYDKTKETDREKNSIYEIKQDILEKIKLLETNIYRTTRKGTVIENTNPLSKEELKAVIDILKNAKHIIETYNMIELNEEVVEIDKTAQEATDIVEETKPFRVNPVTTYVNSLLNPRVIFKKLDNFNENGVLTKMFNDLQNGESEYYRKYLDGIKEIEEFYKQHKRYKNTLGKKVEFNEKTMTKGEMLSLYQLYKRVEAQRHLFKGGFTITDKKGRKRAYKFTEADISAIESMLTENDIAYLEKVHKFFNLYAHNLKFEADVKNQGYSEIEEVTLENYAEGDYFPIKSDFDATYSSIGDPRSAGNRVESVFSYSFNKDLVKGANNTLNITDIDSVVRIHAKQVALYASMYQPIRNISLIWNKPVIINGEITTLRQNISYKWSGAYKYINTLVNDIQGSYTGEHTWVEKALSFTRNAYIRFQLGFNAQTVAKQTIALFNASYRVDYVNLARGVTMRVDYAEMDKYCSYAEYRNSENNVVRTEGLIEKTDNLLEKSTIFINITDRMLMGKLWNACKLQVSKDYNLNINSEECKKKAGKLLEQITRETQPTSTSDKSALLRSHNEMVKQLVQFRTTPLQNISLLVESAYEVSAISQKKKNLKVDSKEYATIETKLKDAKKRCGRAYISVGVSLMVSSGITMLFRTLRNKRDEDETIVSEIFKGVGSEITSMLPIIGEAMSYFFEGYEVTAPTIDTINQSLEGLKSVLDTIKGEEFTESDARKVLFALGQLIGLPTRNIVNTFRSLTNITDKIFDTTLHDDFLGLLYEDNSLSVQKEDIKKYINRNRLDKASNVVRDIFTSRGLVNTPEAIINKYVTFAEYDVFSYPKALSNKVTVNGKEYVLSDEEYSMLQAEYNKAHAVTLKAINFNDFKKLNETSKAIVLNKIYEAYYNKGIDKIEEIEDLSKKKLLILDDAIPMYKLLVYAQKIKEKQSNKPNKKEIAIREIGALPMSRVQKELMMVYLGYSVSNTNIIPTIRNYLTSKGIVGEERDYILSLCG